MPIRSLIKRVFRIAAIPLVVYSVMVTAVYFLQRSMLFFPTHAAPSSRLTPWSDGSRTIGYCREVPNAHTVWLMMHGNAGQAADRDYVLGCMSDHDSLYVLEYPGYGLREGKPSWESLSAADLPALLLARKWHRTKLCWLFPSIPWRV